MDFALPQDLVDYLAELDAFIEAEIKPLEQKDDNIRFFDHRREHARTDWDNQGLPRPEWEALLAEARRAADAAGHLRYAWPVEWGGKGGSNLSMAVIREHLAAKGLGLHNDLQTEHSIVGNNPFIIMFKEFATNAHYEIYGERLQKGEIRTGFGLTTAPTPPSWRPAPSAKKRTESPAGASTARRCGPPACTWPTTS
jgi:acyl-CoA dehydrogenase